LPDTIVGLLRLSGTGGFDHVTTIHTARDGRGNLSKWCIRRARAVYCSESARLDNPLYSSDNTVVPNGIDLAEYRERLSVRSTARRSLGLDEGTVAIVSVAELRPTKNYDCAIDAIALVARREPRIDVRYFICGAGPELGRLKKRVSDLEIPCYVSFLGRRTDIPDILTAADLFLSASSQEGMPLSVIEALAAGLPCVLSPIAEHLEVTAGMDGCYFPAANRPGALATVLEGVLAGPESHRRFSDSREQLLHRLSLTACAAAYDDVYRRSAGALGLAGAPDVDHLSKTPPPGQTA
jgi:glycosyltransferase involved in cell wall biosynthesis